MSGPQNGAQIIVQGQDFVKDGQTVEAVEFGSTSSPMLAPSSPMLAPSQS